MTVRIAPTTEVDWPLNAHLTQRLRSFLLGATSGELKEIRGQAVLQVSLTPYPVSRANLQQRQRVYNRLIDLVDEVVSKMRRDADYYTRHGDRLRHPAAYYPFFADPRESEMYHCVMIVVSSLGGHLRSMVAAIDTWLASLDDDTGVLYAPEGVEHYGSELQYEEEVEDEW